MLKRVLLISCIFFGIFTGATADYGIVEVYDSGFIGLDTSSYYHGRIGDDLYFIKFNTTENKSAEGYFFKAENKLYADKVYFKIENRSGKLHININDTIYILKSDLNFTENVISGRYATKERFLLVFNKYKWRGEINLQKYLKPQFKKYPDLFKTQVYDNIIVKEDIIYGSSKGYWSSYPVNNENYFEILQKGISSSILKKDLVLKMDLYMPQDDTSKNRPFIMFIHGGGFYVGDKKDKPVVEWCKYFASAGYVTASINYRLGFKPTGTSLERAGYRALQDAHAAMRFIVDNKDFYRIDTSMLFTAGTSAGAITALNLAFMRNANKPRSCKGSFIRDDLGDVESSANNIKTNFRIKAVANMWGAVNDLNVFENSKASIVSFHAKRDKIVPIDHNYPFMNIKGNITSYILNKVYGSVPIHEKARTLGINEKLYQYDSDNHTLCLDSNNDLNFNFYTITGDIQEFFYRELIPDPCEIIGVPDIPYKTAMSRYTTNNSLYDMIHWDIEGGLILNVDNYIADVIWFRDSPVHKLMISGYYRNGASFYNEYEF